MARTLEQKALERMCFTQWKAKNTSKQGAWWLQNKHQEKSIINSRRKKK